MDDNWILVEREPRKVGWDEWLEWSRQGFDETRRVAKTTVGEVDISTVFLTVDHAWGGGPPILFETMVFGGPLNEYQWRYSTWDEAVAGHERIVNAVRDGTDPDGIGDA
jgi:hypothetical protein